MMNRLSKILIAMILSTLLLSCSDEGSSNADGEDGENVTVESDGGDTTANGGDGGDVGFSGNTSVEGGTYIGEDGEDGGDVTDEE